MRKASFLSCISLIALLVSASAFAGQAPAHQNKDPWFSSGSVIASVQIVPVPVQSTAEWRVEQMPAEYIAASDPVQMPINAADWLALNSSMAIRSVDVGISEPLRPSLLHSAITISAIRERETSTAETQRTRAVRLY